MVAASCEASECVSIGLADNRRLRDRLVLTFVSAARRLPHTNPEFGNQKPQLQLYLCVQRPGLDARPAGEGSSRPRAAAEGR
jgi:hypothetical protein